VVEAGHRFRLALEPGPPLVVGGGGREDRDGDGAIEAGVARLADLAHSAFAQLREDLIRAEAIPGLMWSTPWAMARPRRSSRPIPSASEGGAPAPMADWIGSAIEPVPLTVPKCQPQ